MENVCMKNYSILFRNILFTLAFVCYAHGKNNSCYLQFKDNQRHKLNEALFPEPKKHPISYEKISLTTPSGISFDVETVNNNSDTALVLGHAFRQSGENMKEIAQLFHPHYDLVLFNYRWAGKLRSYTTEWKNLKKPTEALLTCEKEEIKTVVSHLRALGKYKKVIGLALCYSAVTFIVTQEDALRNNYTLFDKIICDSSPTSVSDLFTSVLKDPLLPANSKKGGFPSLLRKAIIPDTFINICEWGFKVTNTDFPLNKLLESLNKTPILFFHSKNDKLVPFKKFKKLWQAKHGEKVLCLTPAYHIEHHKLAGIYATIGRGFIDCDNNSSVEDQLKQLFSGYFEERSRIPSSNSGNLIKRIAKNIGKRLGK